MTSMVLMQKDLNDMLTRMEARLLTTKHIREDTLESLIHHQQTCQAAEDRYLKIQLKTHIKMITLNLLMKPRSKVKDKS